MSESIVIPSIFEYIDMYVFLIIRNEKSLKGRGLTDYRY
jgi:hypothetical protein